MELQILYNTIQEIGQYVIIKRTSNPGFLKNKYTKLEEGYLHNLYASPNIIRVMKLRGMRWMGQTPHMGKM
jgi:hypothetical protein